MTLGEVAELHYITPLENLGSILENGILSHEKAKRVGHQSIAMQEIQDRRAKVILPNGKRLHTYANLYINARNTMMYKRKEQHRELCVVRVDKDIVHHPTAIVADQNAASSYVRFSKAAPGLALINKHRVFAESWYYPEDQIETWRHKAAMCCEVLIFERVPPEYITGVYVSCPESCVWVRENFPHVAVSVKPYLFFR